MDRQEREQAAKRAYEATEPCAPSMDGGFIGQVGRAESPSSYGEFRQEQVERLFTYHKPTGDQVLRLKLIREAGKMLALTILANTPAGADQADAIRKVREAVMTANAGLVTG